MKKILITGGTGSFGEAFLRKIINDEAYSEIRIFSRDEKKQSDLRTKVNNKKVSFLLGDVRDYSSLKDAMKGVNYVFHAAALKQVPSCEFFPMEAVKTNIVGTDNVLNCAIENEVEKVVILSTDKAVYPINAMGMSKAIMEKVMIAKSRNLKGTNTVLCGTRYGNVMYSRGSVIPTFVSQIKSGKPLTITEPNMTRFLMSLDEAVDLVLFAFENGNQGDIFVQKSPACTISTLAQALSEIFGSDLPLKYIGTRHGEKIYETLINREDMFVAEDLGRYYRIPSDGRDMNYENFYVVGNKDYTNIQEYNSNNTDILDVENTKKLLLQLEEIQNELI